MIHIQAEERFRTAAACLLLTPYLTAGEEHRLPHPMRARVLPALEPYRDHPCAELFQEHVSAGNFGGQFYSLSAWLTPCPPFSWIAPVAQIAAENIPPPMKRLATEDKYPALLTSFYQDARLAQLWVSLQAEWERIRQQCRAALDRWGIEDWMESFWGPASKRLVLVPNPTDPPTFGFGPSNRSESFCIIGPPPVPRSTPEAERTQLFDYARSDSLPDLLIHEFGHTYLRTVQREIRTLAEETSDIARSLALKGRFPRQYADWPEQLEEIMLRAIEGLWRAEKVSRQSADDGIQKDTDRFGLAVLPPIYSLMFEARQHGTALGPRGAVGVTRRALARFRKT